MTLNKETEANLTISLERNDFLFIFKYFLTFTTFKWIAIDFTNMFYQNRNASFSSVNFSYYYFPYLESKNLRICPKLYHGRQTDFFNWRPIAVMTWFVKSECS